MAMKLWRSRLGEERMSSVFWVRAFWERRYSCCPWFIWPNSEGKHESLWRRQIVWTRAPESVDVRGSYLFSLHIYESLIVLLLHRTLTFAATDTTSSALSRTLHLLAQHKDIQHKLREEVRKAREDNGGDDLGFDTLDALPYLDAVCRETLRLWV